MSNEDQSLMDMLTSMEVDDARECSVAAYNGDLPYLFVSYAHANSEKVFRLLELVDEHKFRIWYDEGINPGDVFARVLYNKIKNCSTFLLFLSEECFKSDYVKFEIFTAFALEKRICPIVISAGDIQIPREFQPILANLHQISTQGHAHKTIKELMDRLPPEAKDSMTIDEELHKILSGEEFRKDSVVPDDIVAIGHQAYRHRHLLEKIDLGKVAKIGREAFRGCESLEEIRIPGTVEKIGDSCFRDCVGMKSIYIEDSANGTALEIGERTFENCVSVENIRMPKDLTEIFGGAFNSCKSLESVEIPESVTIIGENAFGSCVALKELQIPESVTKIDDLAFGGCLAMEKVELQEGLLKIGKNAFRDCITLKEMHLPGSLTKLGTSPFRGCTSLESIKVGKSRYFKEESGVLFNKNKSALICYPAKKCGNMNSGKKYQIPDSVTEICEWSFCDCQYLEEIEIPDSVTEIGEGAFNGCTSLKYLEIPDSVTKIDDTAFRNCYSLERIVIPDSVTDLGWGLFTGCSDNVTVVCSSNSKIAKYCKGKQIQFEYIG